MTEFFGSDEHTVLGSDWGCKKYNRVPLLKCCFELKLHIHERLAVAKVNVSNEVLE